LQCIPVNRIRERIDRFLKVFENFNGDYVGNKSKMVAGLYFF